MHQEKCKTIFWRRRLFIQKQYKTFFLATLPLHKISVIRDWYLIQKIFLVMAVLLYACVFLCIILDFLSIEKYYKIIVFILYIRCCCCKLTKRFLFLSQKIDNNNVAMMSHRWCMLMKNRNFNCSIRFVLSNTNHHQSYHKTIHCQPKLSLVTTKFQCLRNKIVKSHPPTFVFK